MTMSNLRRSAFTIATAAVVALVAGCAAPATPSPSPSPTATVTVTPTPTPTPTADADPEDPSTWIISDAGIGPVALGGDFAATLGMLPDTWTNDEACSWTAGWNADDASFGLFFVRGTASDTDPIGEMSVYSAAPDLGSVDGPRTEDGLGVGATVDEILAAHPDADEGADEIGNGTWMRLPGESAGHVFFQFREGEDAASSVVVTTNDQPSYEVCG